MLLPFFITLMNFPLNRRGCVAAEQSYDGGVPVPSCFGDGAGAIGRFLAWISVVFKQQPNSLGMPC